jgi:hypothetical protein
MPMLIHPISAITNGKARRIVGRSCERRVGSHFTGKEMAKCKGQGKNWQTN